MLFERMENHLRIHPWELCNALLYTEHEDCHKGTEEALCKKCVLRTQFFEKKKKTRYEKHA